jgi:hypothetical protein
VSASEYLVPMCRAPRRVVRVRQRVICQSACADAGGRCAVAEVWARLVSALKPFESVDDRLKGWASMMSRSSGACQTNRHLDSNFGRGTYLISPAYLPLCRFEFHPILPPLQTRSSPPFCLYVMAFSLVPRAQVSCLIMTLHNSEGIGS